MRAYGLKATKRSFLSLSLFIRLSTLNTNTATICSMGGIDFYKIATSLTERQVCLKWWRDDGYVCNMLELESVLQLDAFLLQASKGYSGTQPNTVPNQPPFNKPVDMHGENEFGMQYDYFGSEKKRYFSFHNNGCASKVSFKQ
jgi:hypothetical protein